MNRIGAPHVLFPSVALYKAPCNRLPSFHPPSIFPLQHPPTLSAMYVNSLLVTHLICIALSASALPLSSLSRLAGTNAVSQSLASNSSPVTLNVARRLNSTGSSNVLKFDQARAKAFRQRGQASGNPTPAADASTFDIGVTSQAVSYVMQVRVYECTAHIRLREL